MNKKILCVCAQGMNRSKYAAQFLKKRGFDTRYKGSTMGEHNPVTQQDWDWADAIVFVTQGHQEFVHEKFGTKEEEYVLDVSDNPANIPELWVRVKVSNPDKFYQEFTFPRMLEALEKIQQKL